MPLRAAFTAYDLDALARLFVEDAVSDVAGMAHGIGRDQIAAGFLNHTLLLETSVRWRAEVRDLDGDPLVLMWATPIDGDRPEAELSSWPAPSPPTCWPTWELTSPMSCPPKGTS
ncbi:nuclear transport factor 2 family protein [Streptomyces sp. NPDC006274]|uniref:nuclear transport factor 2 family protein n=1 Tax=unclassified Streptomyces TaxID=2593676 RepID=UPI0033BB16B2